VRSREHKAHYDCFSKFKFLPAFLKGVFKCIDDSDGTVKGAELYLDLEDWRNYFDWYVFPQPMLAFTPRSPRLFAGGISNPPSPRSSSQ
jgi:hypothetical protein